jgi:hypothetical protein
MGACAIRVSIRTYGQHGVLAKKKIGLATASATDGKPDDLQNIQRLSRCAVPAGTALGRAVRPGNALTLHPLAYPQFVGVNGHNPPDKIFKLKVWPCPFPRAKQT